MTFQETTPEGENKPWSPTPAEGGAPAEGGTPAGGEGAPAEGGALPGQGEGQMPAPEGGSDSSAPAGGMNG